MTHNKKIIKQLTKQKQSKILNLQYNVQKIILFSTIYNNHNCKQKQNKIKYIYFFNNNLINTFYIQYNKNNRETLVQGMKYCYVEENEFIMKQGDNNAFTFYIFEKGEVEVQINNQKVKKLELGDGFGELALLYSAQRSASCLALVKSYFWIIDRNTFKQEVEQMIKKEYQLNRKFIDKIHFFQNLTTVQKDSIAGALIDQRFYKDQNIVNQDEPASSFYIIKVGQVEVFSDNKQIRTLKAGQSFGETALLQGVQIRTMTVKASENTKCLALGRDVLTQLLGDKIETIIYRNIAKQTLEKAQGFKELNSEQLDKIIDIMNIQRKYKDEKVFINELQPAHYYCIILKGIVKVLVFFANCNYLFIYFQKKKFRQEQYLKGQIIDSQILKQFENQEIQQNFICEENSIVAFISYQLLFQKLEGTLYQTIQRNIAQNLKLKAKSEKLKEKGANIKLEDLRILQKLGVGQFGSVYLVKNIQNNQIFALKIIQKHYIVQINLENHMIEEKKVMQMINHNNLVVYIKSFNDQYFIYFLLEYIHGQELYEVIREIGILSIWDSQFYIGSLILIFEYLHSLNIVYRDIKPENIMINDKGYVKLIDMGAAKILSNNEYGGFGRTFTVIGTPHYMAPEILSGKGYNYFVDLWSIGICLYEFLCGSLPFGEDMEDPYEIYEDIIKKKLQFNHYIKDQKSKNLIQQLLNRQPQMRLGGSFNNLKQHQFFKNMDWVFLLFYFYSFFFIVFFQQKLIDMEYEAPFIPNNYLKIDQEEINNTQGKQIFEQIQEEEGQLILPEKSSVENWDNSF
ncbi:protein kinase domain protein [Ichthyophthirius multifiliis]|uniref:cGMP-dependent protein kinase n=1 Tax=Ichthyophthirius multifiliis TaxID=5932 RepID=G0R3I4_ICHMU|nr:protein kinase domain protein [Ichthyophthirius multifiliis]EGR27973.1 protein kinase domain protein [Ichthyophthirius multifiliis]|eukprot:XP_004027318.1 protein kinase domain protein [Ichthyophthirius multifiliis]